MERVGVYLAWRCIQGGTWYHVAGKKEGEISTGVVLRAWEVRVALGTRVTPRLEIPYRIIMAASLAAYTQAFPIGVVL